jgi:hypothetical protein
MNDRIIKKKKIFFYAVNAGAYATMLPLFDNCPNNYDFVWVAEGYAKRKLVENNILFISVDEFITFFKKKLNIEGLLVLGSQHDFTRTVEILQKCDDLGIKTVFITDHWCNNPLHFTKRDGQMILPTCIFAIDKFVKSELLALDIDENKIFEIGHLGVENKINAISKMSEKKINDIKDSVLINLELKVILVVLEEELELIIDVFDAVHNIDKKGIQIVVKPHPVQDYIDLYNFLELNNLLEKVIVCPEDMNDINSIVIADLVVGINSAILLLPLITGTPIISVQYQKMNRVEKKNMIPYLYDHVVVNSKELQNEIIKKLSIAMKNKINFPQGSINKSWNYLKKLSNHNHYYHF